MKFPRIHTLKEIAQLLDCKYIGNEDFPVLGLNEIHVVEPGDIVFVDHPKYYAKALNSAASVILIDKEVDCPKGKALLISDNPFNDFSKLAKHFSPFVPSAESVDNDAIIGEGTIVQPNVFIGKNVKIGKNCLIHANVTINANTTIGDNVIVHSGTVLGSDAFYYKNRKTHFEKLHSCGGIVIGDDVEIGAACTIDRGVTGNTTIKRNTKIDNQVQIAHDTVIGERCLIASQVGIAGCSIIEDEVTIWGQVGVISGVTIGKGAVVYAQSGVGKDLEGGKSYFGSPCEEARKKYREIAGIKLIPELIAKVNNI